jgi:hypothetical protein
MEVWIGETTIEWEKEVRSKSRSQGPTGHARNETRPADLGKIGEKGAKSEAGDRDRPFGGTALRRKGAARQTTKANAFERDITLLIGVAM